MRGKRPSPIGEAPQRRNIPAYAGKTKLRMRFDADEAEHPRVCGENIKNGLQTLGDFGTSPRMRGKLNSAATKAGKKRNIPAYAGKTSGHPRQPPPPAEHPRVCGENRLILWSATATRGTSPRMRGKPPSKRIDGAEIRNIPAYAGKTRSHVSDWCFSREHPRVCGENSLRAC